MARKAFPKPPKRLTGPTLFDRLNAAIEIASKTYGVKCIVASRKAGVRFLEAKMRLEPEGLSASYPLYGDTRLKGDLFLILGHKHLGGASEPAGVMDITMRAFEWDPEIYRVEFPDD